MSLESCCYDAYSFILLVGFTVGFFVCYGFIKTLKQQEPNK